MKDLGLEYPKALDSLFSVSNNYARFAHVESVEVYNNQDAEFQPNISIIIPTYNAQFVIDAIGSALKQIDAPNYEIVIVDNHSEESVFNKMMEFVKHQDSNLIRVCRNQENLGMYGNWNRGIELSKADYITFLHSDDLLSETCLKDLWSCRSKVETDAAIITYERITKMDGSFVSEDQIPKRKAFGLLKPKVIAKRIKLQLLSPYGNGCGHLFSKRVMEEIGGFGVTGDQGLILNYNVYHPVYDFRVITRIKRVGENESVQIAESFRNYGYYLRNIVIERFFGNNIFLRYISKLKAINTSFSEYGVHPLRKLNFFERTTLSLFDKYVNFLSGYEFHL